MSHTGKFLENATVAEMSKQHANDKKLS